jgi:NADH-quinone oxidoreductase subunit N
MFTNIGAFAVAMALERDDGTGTQLDDFIGLAKAQPLLAFMMAVFMLSLTGIPLTAGFIGKWLVFQAALQAELVPLAVIGVLTSVVSAFYYIRIIVNMYLRDTAKAIVLPGASPRLNWAIYLSFAGTLIIGILPALVTGLSSGVNFTALLIR